MVHIVLKFITGDLSDKYRVADVELAKAGYYGVRTRLGEDIFFFPYTSRQVPGPIQSLVYCVLGLFSGLKQLGLGLDLSPYLASPMGVIG